MFLRTVAQAKTLGVGLRNDAQAVLVRLAGVESALALVAWLPLTTFGLAAAAAAYVLSKALYHMGFQGLLSRTLRCLWRLQWENNHKEALWRLAVHGITGFPSLHGQAGRGNQLAPRATHPTQAKVRSSQQ
ncbi:hypothetical protein PLESTM_000299700 [Pleodorina starrii]|nr:hypothetical protein PLESTM_000299700 [Pleodorina starrii]